MPSYQEKLAFIRAKCIEANPEIVELKFGCKFVDGPTAATIVQIDKWEITSSGKLLVATDSGDVLEWHPSWTLNANIIGRPITLWDVIQVVRKAGYSSTDEWYKTLGHLVDYWSINHDKGDDLNVKSEGTIDFIHDVLKR